MLTAVIWGGAFVAQRVGMDHVGPFAFNGVRFALGALTLLPFLLKSGRIAEKEQIQPLTRNRAILGYCITGLALFGGASLQQMGIVYTTAGKAGFITGQNYGRVP